MKQCPLCGQAIEIVNGKFAEHTIRKNGGPKCPHSGSKA